MPRRTEDEVLAAVRAAVRVVLDEGVDVRRDSRFAEDLGADSLARVEIAEVLELQGLRLADEHLEGLTSVGMTVDYLLARA
jgi:acyl carrier protein